MIIAIKRLVLATICVLMPAITHAASCMEIITKINGDINHYGASIQETHLPWMDLAWLKNHLKIPHTRMLSTTVTEYRWPCGSGNWVTALTDASGKLAKLSGEFNSEKGGGIFSYDVAGSDASSAGTSQKPEMIQAVPPDANISADYYKALMKANNGGQSGAGTNNIPTIMNTPQN